VNATDLPNDTCARLGENIVARIRRSEVTIEKDKDVAHLTIDGDIEVWRCADVLGSRVKDRIATQPLRIRQPFRLAKISSDKVNLMLEDPIIAPSRIAEILLGDKSLTGLVAEARSNLGRIFKSDMCKAVLPDTLTKLNPTLYRARLLNDSGDLAALCEMRVNGGEDIMARVVQALRNEEGK
jgi:hypothetical protein